MNRQLIGQVVNEDMSYTVFLILKKIQFKTKIVMRYISHLSEWKCFNFDDITLSGYGFLVTCIL